MAGKRKGTEKTKVGKKKKVEEVILLETTEALKAVEAPPSNKPRPLDCPPDIYNISHLPDYTILHICQYLPVESLVFTALTSKKLYKLANIVKLNGYECWRTRSVFKLLHLGFSAIKTWLFRLSLPIKPGTKSAICACAKKYTLGGFVRLVSLNDDKTHQMIDVIAQGQAGHIERLRDFIISKISKGKEGSLIDEQEVIVSKDYHYRFNIHKNALELDILSNGRYIDLVTLTEMTEYPKLIGDEVSQHSTDIVDLQTEMSELKATVNKILKTITSGSFAKAAPGRTIKLTFVDSAMKAIVGNGMADVPFGTTLSAAKTIIGGVLIKKVPGRTMARLEWEGVSITDDDEMDAVKDRHEVIVLLQ